MTSGRPVPSPAAAFAATTALLLAAGCAGPRVGRTVDSALPGYTSDTISEVREAGPFYERVETAEGGVRSSYRPFLHTRIDTPDGSRLREVLWPVYADRLQNERFNWRFLIAWGRDADVADPDSAWYVWAFPLWFQGRSKTGEDYAALFPLGGTLRDFLFYDRYSFVLWPIWGEGEHNGIHSTHVLWPIFTRSEGKGHHNLRVFPFWGRAQKDGEWDRRFVLWPIWNEAEYFRHGKPDGYSWALFPVYGHTDRPTVEAWHIVPPFIQVSRGRGRFEGDRQILAPWPFVRISDVRDIHKRHFYPFYATTWEPGRETTHVLWPFWRHDHRERTSVVRDDWSLAPIFHRSVLRRPPADDDADTAASPDSAAPASDTAATEADSAEAEAEAPRWAPGETMRSYTRLWPLFSYVDEEGGSFFRLLDFSLHRRIGALERNILQMPVVYTHGHEPSTGLREDELLWGLFRWRRDDTATRQFQIWPLFRRECTEAGKPGESSDSDDSAPPDNWSIGCGLVGRETDAASGERVTRLLWFIRL